MSHASVLAVASAKGGVGKTTSSINLGAALARGTRQSILLVEADLGMANVLDFLDLNTSPESEPSLHDVLADEAPVDDAIVEALDGFSVLPCGGDLDGFRQAEPRNLEAVLEATRASFDVVIVDTPAGVGVPTLYPLALADSVLLVSNPRVSAIRDTRKTKEIVERVDGTTAGLLLTMAGSGNAPPPARLAEFLEVPLVGSIPEDPTVARAQDAGRPVVAYAPDAPAATAYVEAASRLDLPDGTAESASVGQPGRE